MPKILITGNGFDLSFGLPTSFNDFLNITSRISDKTDFDSVFSSASQFECLSKNFNPIEIDREKAQQLKTKIETNKWYSYFRDEAEITTWIDFEERIEYVLKVIFETIITINKKFFNPPKPCTVLKQYIKPFGELGFQIEIISTLDKFEIIKADFPNESFAFTKPLLVAYKNYLLGIDINKVFDLLQSELNEFMNIFVEYFNIYINPLLDNFKSEIEKLPFDKVNKHFTFNYTQTFSKLYSTEIKTEHIHGKAKEDSNNLVLGINEVPHTDLDQRLFIPFTKVFQKLSKETDYNFLTTRHENHLEQFTFYFYGHSLDSSDAEYINEVFRFNKKDDSHLPNNIKIIVIHHSESSKDSMLTNLIHIITPEEVSYLMKHDILKFMNVNSKELIIDLTNNNSDSLKPVFSRT